MEISIHFDFDGFSKEVSHCRVDKSTCSRWSSCLFQLAIIFSPSQAWLAGMSPGIEVPRHRVAGHQCLVLLSLKRETPESEDVVVARVDNQQILFPRPVIEIAWWDDEGLEAHLGQQIELLDSQRELGVAEKV